MKQNLWTKSVLWFTITVVVILTFLFGNIYDVFGQEEGGEPDYGSDSEYIPDLPLPEYIWSVRWSPDGAVIVFSVGPDSCHNLTNDYFIRFMHPDTQQIFHSISLVNTCSVTTLDWNPVGTMVVSSHLGGGAKVFDLNTVYPLTFLADSSMYGFIQNSWSPMGDKIVSIEESLVQIWNPLTGEILLTFKAVPFPNSITWSSDGTQLATAHEDGIRLWDSNNGLLLQSLTTNAAHAIVWSPDGTEIAAADNNHNVVIWKVSEVPRLRTLTGHTANINEISWKSDSRAIATASDDGTVRVWDVATGYPVDFWANDSAIYTLDWSTDGTKLVYGGTVGITPIIVSPSLFVPTPMPAPYQ